MPIRRGQIEDGAYIPSADEAPRVSNLPENTIAELSTKAVDSETCHLAGDENVTGKKTFTKEPAVPIATEATAPVPKQQMDNAISAAVAGARIYRGTFGTPGSTTGGDLPSNPVAGDLYICACDKASNEKFTSTEAGIEFRANDQAAFNGDVWDKIDANDAVQSVNGQIGSLTVSATPQRTGFKGNHISAKDFSFTTILAEPTAYSIKENGVELNEEEYTWTGGTLTVNTPSADEHSDIRLHVHTSIITVA